MNRPCAKCQKTVYPTEKLSCLDKIWHRACFRCDVCGMTLNMKNYKGYNKIPYCNAHYPTTRPTAVADTPENRRIKANTAIQSNITYHAAFEQEKGKKISVADDPETARVRKNMETISNVSYHGDMRKRDSMEQRRPSDNPENRPPGHMVYKRQGSVHEIEHEAPPPAATNPSPYSARAQPTTVYSSSGPAPQAYQPPPQQQQYQPPPQQQRAPPQQFQPPPQQYQPPPQQQRAPQQQYQPPAQQYQPPPQQYQPPPQQYQPPPQQQRAPPMQQNKGEVFKALYDYEAADDDEVSFMEGDDIVNTERIDEGWMTGTVQRTGQTGMLPANYVEKSN